MRSKLPVTGNSETYPPLFGLGNGKTVSTPHCPEPKVLLASDKATITLYLLPNKEGRIPSQRLALFSPLGVLFRVEILGQRVGPGRW
jgi:hypothetical protein